MAIQQPHQPRLGLSDPEYIKLRNKAAEVMDAPDTWMATTNEQLGFRRPDEVLAQYGDRGRKIVEDLIEAIKEGVFS